MTDPKCCPDAVITDQTAQLVVEDDCAVIVDVGVAGPPGPQGPPGVEIDCTPPTNTSILWIDECDPGDMVIPPGGSTGEVLAKQSNADYDSGWVALALGDLADVDAPAPAPGEVLAFDGVEWVPVPSAMPTGGTTGQVLAKTSGTDYDTAWSTIAQGDQPRLTPTSGTLYVPRHIGGTFALSTAGMGVQGFTLTAPAVINQIRFRVTVGSAGLAAVALYGSTSQSAPDTLIWTGTADTTSTGFKAVSLSESLTPGTYWVGVMGNTATATVYGDAATTSTPSSGAPRNAGGWDNLPRSGAYYFTSVVTGVPDVSPTWLYAVNARGVTTIEVRFA